MAIHTKEKILASARRLFNERGYSHVSMRAIADDVGISPGNLTYHFKQKADIVTALMNQSFDQTYLSSPILTLDDLLDQFRRMLDTIQLNAFYFLDPEFSDSPRAHNQVIRERIEAGFETLIASGVLSPACTPEIRQTIVSILLMAHMSWLRSVLRSSGSMSKEAFIDAHLLLIRPYLLR